MDVTILQVDWAPNRFFDSDDDGTVPDELFASTGGPLAERLELAYLERVSRYKQDIEEGYNKIRWGNYPWPERYPALKVDLPGGAEIITFDEELDARLIELYVLHGWDGILRLEGSLECALRKRGAGYFEPWFVVKPFYLFTRNRLILLIRQALIEVEKKAAQDIVTRLSLTAREVGTAWTEKFRFDEIKQPTEGGAEGGPGSDTQEPSRTFYAMGNHKLSSELFLLLGKTVGIREHLDEQNKKRERLETCIEEGELEFGKGNAPGLGGTYMELEDTKKQIEQKSADLNALCEKIEQSAPLALLALPLLRQPFSRPDMENVIGETLWPFYGKLDQLGKAIDPQKSQIEMSMRGIQGEAADVSRSLESMFPMGYDLENECAEAAISEVVDNPSYLALLSEETLNRLILTEVIKRGTLAHFVCQRYITILVERIGHQRESEEKLKAKLQFLAQVGAGLSLASYVYKPLRIPASVLGLPFAFFQAYSVIHQLSVFDQAVNLRLAEARIIDLRTLAGIAEIGAMRAEYAQQITQTMVTEIGLILAAGKWEVFKKALCMRDYYNDLETLLE